MRKIFQKKLIALVTLLTLTSSFAISPASAQEVKLLPNATDSDYEVQTIPPQGQDYRIRTTSPDEPSPDNVLLDLLENPLGTLFNRIFQRVVTDPLQENMGKWVGDLIQWTLINLNILLGGEGGMLGSGLCRADQDTKAVIENNCREDAGYLPLVTGEKPRVVCLCTRETAFNPTQGAGSYGAIGILGSMSMGLLQQSPPNLHTAQYLKQELADNILAGPVYAQTGVSYFAPIIGITQIFRNVAYVFMAAILVLMGLMVMLRYKVDPRTTMTVTAALPRIAVSIILIAFSYPLAGMMVDIGRLLKAMFDSLFTGMMWLSPIEPFRLIVDFVGNWIGGFVLGNLNLGGIGAFSFLISLGLLVIAIVVAFMLFFTLVFRFAALYAQVIFAPLAFAWGTLPGQEETITKWFKSFAVNVLTFPIIYFLVNLANYIAVVSTVVPLPLPSDLGWATMSTFLGPTNVGGLVAFGLLIAATKVPAMLEEALEVSAPAAVARAGAEPGKILTRLPVVGSLFK